MPLPAGLDIPEEPGLKLVSITLRQAPGYGFGLTVILNPPERTPGADRLIYIIWLLLLIC